MFYLALQQTNDLITDSYCTEASVIKNGEVDDVGMKLGPQKSSQSLILVHRGNFMFGRTLPSLFEFLLEMGVRETAL